MKAIILAGGKATRLPQSAKDIPKPLVEVRDKPILQHQLDLLEKYELKDIRLSLGFRAEQIIDYIGNKYEHVVEPHALGTGGAIKFASQDLKDDFMVLNGDILCDLDLERFVEQHRRLKQKGTIAVYFCKDASDFGLIRMEKERIVQFLEKPKEKCSGYINAGFYILSPEVFKDIRQETFSIEHEIFPNLARDKQLQAYIHKGYWTDLGTEKRLEEARRRRP